MLILLVMCTNFFISTRLTGAVAKRILLGIKKTNLFLILVAHCHLVVVRSGTVFTGEVPATAERGRCVYVDCGSRQSG